MAIGQFVKVAFCLYLFQKQHDATFMHLTMLYGELYRMLQQNKRHTFHTKYFLSIPFFKILKIKIHNSLNKINGKSILYKYYLNETLQGINVENGTHEYDENKAKILIHTYNNINIIFFLMKEYQSIFFSSQLLINIFLVNKR